MEVIIKQTSGETFLIDAEPTDTFTILKQRIQGVDRTLIPTAQLLTYQGRQLEDFLCLQDYNIQHNSVITLIFRTGGDGHHNRFREQEQRQILAREWQAGFAARNILHASMTDPNSRLSHLHLGDGIEHIQNAILQYVDLSDADILWEARKRCQIFVFVAHLSRHRAD